MSTFSADPSKRKPDVTPITLHRCHIVASTPLLNSATAAHVEDTTRLMPTNLCLWALGPDLGVETLVGVLRDAAQATSKQVVV